MLYKGIYVPLQELSEKEALPLAEKVVIFGKAG